MSPQQTVIFQISGITTLLLWGGAYLLIIRRAFKDQSYGMPFGPMCVNVAYEFTFGFVFPDVPPMKYANIAWFFIDLVIVYQYLRFGWDEFPALFPKSWFVPSVVLGIATAFAGVVAMTVEFRDVNGNYSGWGDQLLISISYVALLARRQSLRGQSVYILLTRMFGSIALIPGQYLQAPDSVLLVFLYVAFIVLDLIYLTLLLRQCRCEGMNPWRRL